MKPYRFARTEPGENKNATSGRLSRIEWTPIIAGSVMPSLLREWFALKIIGKSSYVKLAVWVLADKPTASIDCADYAAQLTDDQLKIKVSASDVKQAIVELEKAGFCQTEQVVQFSLLDTLNN